jgi:hypothetical protein
VFVLQQKVAGAFTRWILAGHSHGRDKVVRFLCMEKA